jgi:4-amino-4-deoxy-L-arabinose transferase-like glycosyltransferase
MNRPPHLQSRCVWGTASVLVGGLLLAAAVIGTPELVARFLSPDGHLSEIGRQQVTVLRRMLATWGGLAILIGAGLAAGPLAFRRLVGAQLERHSGRLVTVGIVLFFILFTFNSVFRTARFSPDSMNYVDVARNIGLGHGIVQSTLGFNQEINDPGARIPVPFTVQPPLYPILIALLGWMKFPHAEAALLLAAIGYAAIVLLLFLLARSLYRDSTARIVLVLVLAYQPLHWVAGYAWSDTVCLAFFVGGLGLLVDAARRLTGGGLSALAAGFLAGLAIDTRYGVTPMAALAPAFLLLGPAPWRSKLRRSALASLGLTLALGPLILRIHRLEGGVVPGHIGSTQPGLLGDLVGAATAILGRYAGFHPIVELPALLLATGALLALLVRRGQLAETLRDGSADWARRLPLLWPLLYVAFIIMVRRHVYIEPFGSRYILPAGLLLLLPAAFVIERVWRPDRVRIAVLVLCVVVFKIAAELVLLHSGSTFRPADPVVASARLTWVARQTSDRDLILGDDTMDIPFWLRRPAAVSFSPDPAPNPTYEKLRDVCRMQATRYDRFFIVLRNNYSDDGEWRRAYGPFIADLVQDRLERYPGIRRVTSLDDGHVFEIRP